LKRVDVKDTTYVAPAMIYHYIRAHAYLQPIEFLRAVEDWPSRSTSLRLRMHPSRQSMAVGVLGLAEENYEQRKAHVP
jgi:hypothetical protein